MGKFPISEEDLKMLNVNTSIDIITVTCTLTKMKGDMRFYHALAISSIVGKGVKDIFQVIRHGVRDVLELSIRGGESAKQGLSLPHMA